MPPDPPRGSGPLGFPLHVTDLEFYTCFKTYNDTPEKDSHYSRTQL